MREVRETARFRKEWNHLYGDSTAAGDALDKMKEVLARHGEIGYAVPHHEGFLGLPLHPPGQSALVIYRLLEHRIDLVTVKKVPRPGELDHF